MKLKDLLDEYNNDKEIEGSEQSSCSPLTPAKAINKCLWDHCGAPMCEGCGSSGDTEGARVLFTICYICVVLDITLLVVLMIVFNGR